MFLPLATAHMVHCCHIAGKVRWLLLLYFGSLCFWNKKVCFFVFLNSLFFVLIEQCIFTGLCFLSWLIISQDSIGLGVSSLDVIFFSNPFICYFKYTLCSDVSILVWRLNFGLCGVSSMGIDVQTFVWFWFICARLFLLTNIVLIIIWITLWRCCLTYCELQVFLPKKLLY